MKALIGGFANIIFEFIARDVLRVSNLALLELFHKIRVRSLLSHDDRHMGRIELPRHSRAWGWVLLVGELQGQVHYAEIVHLI